MPVLDIKRQPITPGCKLWVYSRTGSDGKVEEYETLMDVSAVAETPTGFSLTVSPAYTDDYVALQIHKIDEAFCVEVMHHHHEKQVTVRQEGTCIVTAPDNGRAVDLTQRLGGSAGDIDWDDWSAHSASSYTPHPTAGAVCHIPQQFYTVGFVQYGLSCYKDEHAYKHRPDEICYIPACVFVAFGSNGHTTITSNLAEQYGYTRKTFVEACGGNEALAKAIFAKAIHNDIPVLLSQMDGATFTAAGADKSELVPKDDTLQNGYTKQPTQNGHCYKNEQAFNTQPKAVCYIPESAFYDSNGTLDAPTALREGYTRNDIVNLCKGNVQLAELVFAMADYEHLETTLAQLSQDDFDTIGLRAEDFQNN